MQTKSCCVLPLIFHVLRRRFENDIVFHPGLETPTRLNHIIKDPVEKLNFLGHEFGFQLNLHCIPRIGRPLDLFSVDMLAQLERLDSFLQTENQNQEQNQEQKQTKETKEEETNEKEEKVEEKTITRISDRATLLKYFGSQTTQKSHIDKIKWLGRGAFCSVYKLHGYLTKNPNEIFSFAGKFISSQASCKKQAITNFFAECHILENLHHKNIITLFAYHQRKHYIYLPLYDCSLADIRHDFRSKVNEPAIKHILFQILSGVHYLHNNNIIHRDIACKNILLSLPQDNVNTSIAKISEIVISDFGAAIRIPANESKLNSWVTTPSYAAPEINNIISNGPITKAIDLWSVGCLMADLLTGTEFFNSHKFQTLKIPVAHYDVLIEKIGLHKSTSTNKWEKDEMLLQKQFASLSKLGLDFLSKLLEIDPTKRMMAKEALEHSWFLQTAEQEEKKELAQFPVQETAH
jgi:serine/threonine protein kinase